MTRRVLIITILAMVIPQLAFSQAAHTVTNYKKALWMTTRFYGAQRSGDNNWLLYNHLPGGVNAALTGRAFRADAHTDGTDLSGGWHDCGDHVKFGQTQFYSAYLLLKGYSEFPTGYDDRYSQNYTGYKAAGNWTFEGTGHDPNCIPDVLDEMKHETDFLIKCIPNATNFYYQVGNGGAGADHCEWATAVKIQTNAVGCGGNNDNGTTATPLRPACKNPNDASMASFCGATLALMSRMYQPYDAAYAALCLTHAQYAYTYAKNHPGRVGTCFGGFYGANDNWEDDYVTMCCELYWATNNNAYRTEAEGMEGTVVFNAGWSFDYSNNGEIALYNLAKIGNANGLTRFNNRITGHFMNAGSRNGQGVYTAYGGGWGALRYNGNAAFLIALYSKLNNNIAAATLNYMYKDIDYIMGNNGSNQSYIVGFAPTVSHVAPQYPHHRNVYLVNNNPPDATVLTIPAKNQQFGALVGGKRDATFNDSRADYVNTEVCIDYNAGLVGALAYINSLLSPVTISCGGNACWKPNLGADKSTCSQSLPITLDANAGNPGGAISYRWYTWNGTTKTVISGQTARTYSANAIGGYIVERDSAYTGGPCTKRDTIWITSTIPTPTLTGPLEVCNPATYNLTPTNIASMPGGTTYQWAVDYAGGTSYSNLTGETGSTLANVRRAGRYQITATSGSCNSTGNVVVTSLLPIPVDGCSASTGTVSLSIANTGTGPYQWYAAATGGSSLGTGTTFTTPSISSTTTYYVQDMAAASGTVGPTVQTGATTSWGVNTGLHLAFTASQNFTINSLQIPMNVYSNVTSQITLEIIDGSGNAFVPAKTFVSNATSVTTAQHQQLVTFAFTGFTIQSSWGPNLRMRITNKGSFDDPLWNAGTPAFPYNSSPSGIVSITGSFNGTNPLTQYNYFYNWQISTGTPCSRLPVIAKIGSCSAVPVQFLSFTGKDNVHSVLLNWITGREKNNDRFTVMKSVDGENFEAIGTVKGKGDSNNPTQYSFADVDAGYGVNYYKIIQHDYNGESDQTEVILVNKISKVEMLVAPNPFNNSTEIRLMSSVEGSAELRILDVQGNIVEERPYTLNSQASVGAHLPIGVYVVQIITGDQVVTARVVKQ